MFGRTAAGGDGRNSQRCEGAALAPSVTLGTGGVESVVSVGLSRMAITDPRARRVAAGEELVIF